MLANPNQSNLSAQHNRDRVPLVGTVVDLCLIVVASILFNVFPDKVGLIRSLSEPTSFAPLLAPDFQNHVPMLNLYWGLAFSLGIANLVALRWNIATRWLDLALSILGIFVLIELVLGGSLTVYRWLDLGIKIGLAVAIIPAIIDAIRKTVQVLGGWEATVQTK